MQLVHPIRIIITADQCQAVLHLHHPLNKSRVVLKMFAKICASLFLIEASVAVPVDPKAAAAAMIKKMTLDEKVCQLFAEVNAQRTHHTVPTASVASACLSSDFTTSRQRQWIRGKYSRHRAIRDSTAQLERRTARCGLGLPRYWRIASLCLRLALLPVAARTRCIL